jgi:hypothetical protein
MPLPFSRGCRAVRKAAQRYRQSFGRCLGEANFGMIASGKPRHWGFLQIVNFDKDHWVDIVINSMLSFAPNRMCIRSNFGGHSSPRKSLPAYNQCNRELL